MVFEKLLYPAIYQATPRVQETVGVNLGFVISNLHKFSIRRLMTCAKKFVSLDTTHVGGAV